MSMVSFELPCSNRVAAQVGGNSHFRMDAVVLASFEQQAARHPNLEQFQSYPRSGYCQIRYAHRLAIVRRNITE